MAKTHLRRRKIRNNLLSTVAECLFTTTPDSRLTKRKVRYILANKDRDTNKPDQAGSLVTLPDIPSRFGIGEIPAAKTRCDMDYTEFRSEGNEEYKLTKARQKMNPYTNATFDPKWGEGKPVIDYWTEYKKLGPCMQKIITAHEEEHVKNATTPCESFKKCVDAADTSLAGGMFGKTVSLNSYIDCYNKNNAGLAANCDADEQAAYGVSATKALAIQNDPVCAAEKAEIAGYIPVWQQRAQTYTC